MVKNIVPAEYTTVDFDPFAGPEIIGLAPATESQKEIMTSCLVGGDSANRAFNESVSLKFSGQLDKEALEKALHDLINRHEALHSAFSGDGKQICIFNNPRIQPDYKDISEFTELEQQEIISDLANQEALRLFDLLNGPLLRVKLLRLSGNKSYLTIIAHHIICDGWSFNIILQELGKLYSGYVQNTFAELPAAIPFSTYACQQQKFYESDEYKQIENYWISQHKNNEPALNLPADFSRPALRTYKSNRIDYKVSADMLTGLKKLSNESGCSFVTTLIASFEIFLHRFTGQKTFTLGLPAAGQSATGNYNLVGHCVNLLPLKTVVDNTLTFHSYLKQRKKIFLESLEKQQFSFGSLLKKLNIPREASRIALVPAVLNIDMGMNDGVSFYGLTHELVSNAREFETFELFLNISGSEKTSLTFEWSYNTQLFQAETINRMMKGFNAVLKTAVENPFIKIINIELSDTKNLPDQLSEWNATDAAYDREVPIHELIARSAEKNSEKTALIFNDKKINYKTLNDTANQLANCLIQKGIKPGDVVGVALHRSPHIIISLLAVMKTGAAYVPIDPEYPEERIKYMLKDSSAKMLISSPELKEKFGSDVVGFFIENDLPGLAGFSKNAPDLFVSANDLAYILYTSGTTGKPKGVLVKHHNLVNILQSMIKMPGITEADTLLAVTTVSFDIAALEMYLPLITGSTTILANAEAAKDGRELLKIIKEQLVTIMQATPSTYKIMLAAGWEQQFNFKILCCGEPMTKDLADKLCVRCNALFNMYGPTETTIYSTGKKIDINDDIITIGRPINNTKIYILDEAFNHVATGAAGEIYIAGEGVAKGYANMPELTAEKFITNPFASSGSEKMYRTGDLGKFLNNGEIQCLGRIDRQIKVRGYRIEPGEIESEIMKCGRFKETFVMLCNNKKLIGQLTAFIVPEPQVNEEQFFVTTAKLKEKLRKSLPLYMVPDQFIEVERLPLLLNGKIDFNALSEISAYAKTYRQKTTHAFTETEKLLVSVWSAFLNHENIGVDDNFFEMGGHSLIAVEVMMRIEKETGVSLPLSTLFEYPTIKKLAALLQSDKKDTIWKCLVPIKPFGTKMPVYIIHGSGLNVLNFSSIALHVDENQPVFGLQAKGLNGSDEPLNNMEEIAAEYLKEVLEHNPEGPYALAGYSFGGYVGIEMARQLRLMGKKVKMLAMFDTNAEVNENDSSILHKISVKSMRQFRKLLWISASLLEEPKSAINYQLHYTKNKINSIAQNFSLVTKEEQHGALTEFTRISEHHDVAYRNYRMKPFDGTIDLFKAKTRVYFVDDAKFLGWKKFALKGVRVHEVPGDHKTMLLAPYDKYFGRALQNALDNC